MPASPAHDVVAARLALGQRLAMLRKIAGHTQQSLAPLTLYGRSTVANVESGRQSVGRDFWTRCDDVFATSGALARDYDRIRTLTAEQGRHGALAYSTDLLPRQPGSHQPSAPGTVSLLSQPCLEVQPRHRDIRLRAPEGRYFLGLDVFAQLHPAMDDGRVLAAVPAGYHDDAFLNAPGRGLVIGQADTSQGPRWYGLDTRHARRRLRRSPSGSRLIIPHAYRLDELTFGLLWAVANLDEALLNDDGLIDECRNGIVGYEQMSRSAASGDLAEDLTPVGRMLLGSAFCAGHIRRHAATLADSPTFWTREQRGEEASTWLLFTHKHEYLQAIAARFATAGARTVRAFCVPRSAVEVSPPAERILLLLTVALMQSHRIHVVITDEPEYAATAGFVSDQRTAIVANWVGAAGIWHVDVIDRQSTLREYTDAGVYAAAHSVIAAPTPHDRLRVLADYLGLDWPWLRRRCAELAEHGCAGIVQPRSRHLSVAGVDRACRYLAGSEPDTY
jgi:hypothetical protein